MDPDARITKMKDGTTHLAYKAEYSVDLESNLILAAEVYHTTRRDHQTLEARCIWLKASQTPVRTLNPAVNRVDQDENGIKVYEPSSDESGWNTLIV